LSLPAYIAWVRSKSEVLFASTTLPLILTIAFFGYPTAGLAILMAQPLVPLLVGAAVGRFDKRIASALFVILLTEYIFFIWSMFTRPIFY